MSLGGTRIQHIVEPIDGSASALHARTKPRYGKDNCDATPRPHGVIKAMEKIEKKNPSLLGKALAPTDGRLLHTC